jgi:phosphate:Na+ symporter
MSIGLAVATSIAVFLLGMDLLADALRAVGPERLEPWLARVSRTPLRAVGVGIAVTALLDSSSAVIVLLLALVSTGALAWRPALGVVLGSNIGTTIGSQVIALDLGWLGPGLLVAGVVGSLVARNPTVAEASRVARGMGLLFVGLGMLDDAVRPLRDDPTVLGWLRGLEDPVTGALAGGLTTVVIQSSSATVGVAIGLAKAGVLTLPAGVSVMLGAEIGTCADTLVAAAGRGPAAMRVGAFHLGFNVVSVMVGLALIGPLAAVASWATDDVGQQLANAHVLFNSLGALVALPLLGVAARGLERLWPDAAPGVGEGRRSAA